MKINLCSSLYNTILFKNNNFNSAANLQNFVYNVFVDLPIFQLKIQDTRFTDLPIKLVVSIKYRFSVDSFRYATKKSKRKAKNHNLKLKTLSVQTFVSNVGVGFIRPETGSMNRTPTKKVNSYTITIIIKTSRRKYL